LLNITHALDKRVGVATGHDIRGRSVTPGDTALNALSNATPIPAQGMLHYFNNEGPDRDGFAQVLQSLGAENYVYRPQAEKLRAEDELRQGGQPNLLLFDPNDRREIMRNSKLTPLQARFVRLPMADALQVWDAATNAEKAELSQEFIKKKSAYMKKLHNEGPGPQANDRTYRRLIEMGLAE